MTVAVYPIFLEFIRYVSDDFWKLLYENMAFNKFPSGVYIIKDHFCCLHKGKEFSVKLDNTHKIFVLFTHVHALLKNKMGIQSEKEKLQLKEDLMYSHSMKDDNIKRLIKDLTLTSFVIRMGEEYNIPDTIIVKIFSLLIIGFMFKTILIKDVVFYENHDIQSINGFYFEEKRVRLNRNILTIKQHQVSVPVETSQPESTKMSSYWTKYLNQLVQSGFG